MDSTYRGVNTKKIENEDSLRKQPSVENMVSDISNPSRSAKSYQKLKPSEMANSQQKLGEHLYQLETEDDRSINARLMELEGQCKIKSWEFIKFNKCQAVVVVLFLIVTVVGLFAVKYSPWIRRFLFFNQCDSKEATHIFIKGNDKKEDIVKILNEGCQTIEFMYKKLKYNVSSRNQSRPIPCAFQLQRQFEHSFSLQRLKHGLSAAQVKAKLQHFGPNQHLVDTPSYPEYLIDVMTEPFFLLQYFFCVMFFVQNYAPFAIALLFFSFITTTINYILLYISYKKIKQIAEKAIQVTVVRQGKQIQIDSRQLVPGDVYIPKQMTDVPADCIVGFGDVYVNQANLTGESFPIGKFKIQEIGDIQNSSMWIYEGSKILETKKGNTYTVVVNTGFTTHRGRIIRKIMNRTVKDPDIIRTTLIFVLEVVAVSMITFFAVLFLLLSVDIEKIYIFFKFIDFLASSAPPPMPIFFNLAYSLSLFRLGYKGITGTEPQKTVDGAQVKTFCFDKTGTLTRNDVSLSKVFKITINQNKFAFSNVVAALGESQNHLIWKLFSTCHTTKIINDQLLGDEIDKQMFHSINAVMQSTTDPNIRFVVKNNKAQNSRINKNDLQMGKQEIDLIQLERKRASVIRMKNEHHLQVLRLNQFQSKFQSMSVLVRDVISNKFYVFAKGSPQKLLANSSNISQKSQNSNIYMKMIKTLSLNGFRTIAMGFKQLQSPQEVSQYLKCDRELYLNGIINLGLIAFQNKLKVDTWLTIDRLVKSNIDPKMITGDNIYIAVETARRAGILGTDEKVVFLQGTRNIQNSIRIPQNEGKFTRIFQGTVIQKLQEQISQNEGSNFKQTIIDIHEKADYLKGGYTFAVDNTFLTMDPPPLLSHNIKVFARIPPENKAFVIRQYKKQHNQYIRTHYSRFTRWLKTKKWKIGMCGDGANDLLALRQADLSIGIQATDASYGSSFTVNNMLDVDWVIKQSKNTQANIIQLYQFYASTTMFILISSIILITDATYFSTPGLMYMNFGTVLIIPATIAMARPYGEQSTFVPDANMMGLHNHLIFWGNLLMPFTGILGSWFYFYNTDQFLPNSKPTVTVANGGFNSKNMSCSLIFVLVLLVVACNGFIIYRSKPWRQRFYRNYLFTLLIIANITIALIFAFLMEQTAEAMQFYPISIKNVGICVGITFGAILLNFVYNTIVNCFKLDHKIIVLEKEQARLASMIMKPGRFKVRDSLHTI